MKPNSKFSGSRFKIKVQFAGVFLHFAGYMTRFIRMSLLKA